MLKKVTLRLACFDYEAEEIEDRLLESDLPQLGLICLGCSTEDLTESELERINRQISPELLKEIGNTK